ncbi:MAG: AraC family transcriptional regulator [Verrucomicrobia bacterium]|nr:AraC family transcriptional regulator [Verrucomicrobiota bacterium]
MAKETRMEKDGTCMDKIGFQPAPELLAAQIVESRYFFLPACSGKESGGKGFRVALGGWEVCRTDYAVRRTRYPFHVLELVLAGAGSAVVDGVELKLEPGVCFAYGPRSRCEITAEGARPLRKFFLGFSGREVPGLLLASGLAPGGARRTPVPGELAAFAEMIVEEGRRQGRNAEAVCGHLARGLLLKIGETETAGAGDAEARARSSYERCRALVDANARTWGSLREIAEGCGLERSSVCRLFRRFAGVTPGRYLMRRKMNLAAAHLIEHGGWVKEAAAHVGLADPLHFSRCFRQVHGVPPSALLRRGLETSSETKTV